MEHSDKLVNIARELLSIGKPGLSRRVLEDCVQEAPTHLEAWLELANVLVQLNDLHASLEASRHAAALAPQATFIQYNVAQIAHLLSHYEIELPAREHLAQSEPDRAEHTFCLAEVLDRLGQFEQALSRYRLAVLREPDNAKFHIHLGYALLRLGHWHEGWKEMGWYWSTAGLNNYSPWFLSSPRPKLHPGDPIQGKRILVTGWGGLGDLIMFTPLASHLIRRGAAQVSLHVANHVAFFSTNRWGLPVVTGTAAHEFTPLVQTHDAWVPNAALAAVLELEPHQVGIAGSYFRVEPIRQAKWRQRLLERGSRLRIGLAWSGNPGNLYEKNRSIPTHQLLPLIRGKPDVDWYVVQKNERNNELAAHCLPQVCDCSASFDELEETAALMAELDLIISVDSMPAHLSASLGRPTWLLLGASADWRWGLSDNRTPWYESIHIYRQVDRTSWKQLLDRVASDLTQFCANHQGLNKTPI